MATMPPYQLLHMQGMAREPSLHCTALRCTAAVSAILQMTMLLY